MAGSTDGRVPRLGIRITVMACGPPEASGATFHGTPHRLESGLRAGAFFEVLGPTLAS